MVYKFLIPPYHPPQTTLPKILRLKIRPHASRLGVARWRGTWRLRRGRRVRRCRDGRHGATEAFSEIGTMGWKGEFIRWDDEMMIHGFPIPILFVCLFVLFWFVFSPIFLFR